MFPKVVQVIPTENYRVYVYFEDGKIVCYDATKLIERPVFLPLKDKDVFINKCTVLNDTLAWDINGDRSVEKCLDIDPDTLYELESVNENIA